MSQKLERLEQEEYEAWRHLPATRKFLRFLEEYREHLMELWAEGRFQRDLPESYVLQDSDAVARAQIYKDLVELQFEDIYKFYHPQPQQQLNEEDDGSDTEV